MTEQRFDIAVQDKVARTIKTELAAIGASANTAHGFIRSLKAEMAGMASAQGGMAGASTTATRALREEAAAANAARTALAAQRQESEALTRALNAQAAAQRSVATASRDAGTVGSGVGGLYGPPAPAQRPTTAVPPINTAGVAAATQSVRELGGASQLSAQYAAQLGFQLNDVFVSLASGQKPMTVFIQQGAQIAQLPAQAGLSWKQFGAAAANTLGIIQRTGDAALDAAAAQALAALAGVEAANAQAASNVRAAETEVALAAAQQQAAITANEQAVASARLATANTGLAAANAEAAVSARALATAQGNSAEASNAAELASTRGLGRFARGGLIAAAVAAGLAIALGAVRHEAESDESLRQYARTLGLTAREIKKLDDVTVTWGDTAKAVFQVAWRNIAQRFNIDVTAMQQWWQRAVSNMVASTRSTVSSIYAAFAGMGYGVNNILQNLGDGKSNDNALYNLIDGYREAYADAQKFFDDVGAQQNANARNRISAQARELIGERTPRAARTTRDGWNRAKQLADDNAELDAQIRLLGLYGEELERATQLEAIAQRYREHGVPLTEAETEALRRKLQTLQEGRRIQEAMTAVDENLNGASRRYEDSIAALDRMLARNIITQEQYDQQLRLVTRAFDDATDPLANFNRELQRSGELMGSYGRDRDVADYIQSLEQAAQAMGQTIYQPGSSRDVNGDSVVTARGRTLNPDAQSAVDEFRAQQQQSEYARAFEAIDPRQNVDPTNSAYILDKYKELYEEIDRLRQADVISEEEAVRRKQMLDQAHLDARLEHTSTVLGMLTTLQSSKNKEAAAIGKAAAIAQATIDGYRAVQAALAGPPGPPWSFAIAGATAAITAVNVAKIAGVGFMSGGYTGNMATNQVAGAVHGQEYVFDAAATKRIGVPALDAMRRNASLTPAANDAGGRGRASIRVVQGPGVYAEVVERSDGEIEVIAERVARRVAPDSVAKEIKGNPNGRASKAMAGAFGLKRADR